LNQVKNGNFKKTLKHSFFICFCFNKT